MPSTDLILSHESLLYRGVREEYLDVHMKDIPKHIARALDRIKAAEGLCVLKPTSQTEDIIKSICMLNAYVVKYFLVKYEGHKTIQISNMNMFVKFENDGLERLQGADFLIMEFADLLVVNHLVPKQVLTTIASILLERIGSKKITLVEFHSSDFTEALEADEDNPFAKFILGCLDITTKVPL